MNKTKQLQFFSRLSSLLEEFEVSVEVNQNTGYLYIEVEDGEDQGDIIYEHGRINGYDANEHANQFVNNS